jgi:multimeric flavodoxin WrbA
VKALFINCTLKPAPEKSNSEALGRVVSDALEAEGVDVEWVRATDHNIVPGVETDMGDGDDWPPIHDMILDSEILVLVTPTWLGKPSSVAQRVCERMDAMLSEEKDDGTPVAYNRVGGVVVTGNEDGAHHVISELSSNMADIGFTIPGQAFTYWNKGPGPGEDYLDTQHGHPYSETTGKAAASNILAVAKALEANPVPAPPS